MSDSITPAALGQLEDLLQHRLRGQVREVRVLLREGRVVLQGRAASYHAKQLAQHLLLRTLETAILVNEVEVRRPLDDDRVTG
jgi:hypothetical protein